MTGWLQVWFRWAFLQCARLSNRGHPFEKPNKLAALELDNTSLANGVYAYHTVIRLDVAHNVRIAPFIVSLLMAKMQLDEPSIAFSDGNEHRIDNNDLPHDKATFNSTFPTTTRHKSLHCHFIIQSNRSFHNVKIGIWDRLQQHPVFMDKSPGTIKKTDFVPLGFWLHLHPGFASSRSFHTQLCKDLLSKYASTNLALLNLPPTFSEPGIFFTPAKCRSSYEGQALQTHALTMYCTRDDFDRTTTLLTRPSTYTSQDNNKTHLYVSFALKTSHPEV
jgi:hypothetical protein